MSATFFICVSGAIVVELGYGVLVSYVGRSSSETDFEYVIGACVFFVVVWSEFRLQYVRPLYVFPASR